MIRMQQWVEEQTGLCLQLLTGAYVLVEAAGLQGSATAPAAAAALGAIPWRLRQVVAVESTGPAQSAAAAVLVLSGGHRVCAGEVATVAHLADMQGHEVSKGGGARKQPAQHQFMIRMPLRLDTGAVGHVIPALLLYGQLHT